MVDIRYGEGNDSSRGVESSRGVGRGSIARLSHLIRI
jgi:hypothetical protein